METARSLADRGIKIFRAGIWKPRTKPRRLRGYRRQRFGWLKRVKQETGMYVTTEVATKDHVFEALKAGVDLLWIGARTDGQPLRRTGNCRRTERGRHPCPHQEPRSTLIWSCGLVLSNAFIAPASTDWQLSIAVLARMTEDVPQPSAFGTSPSSCAAASQTCPFSCDPSHIGGKRELIAPALPAGHGLELRRTDYRIALQPGCCMERRRPADYAGRVGLRVEPPRHPRLHADDREPDPNCAAKSTASTSRCSNSSPNGCASPAKSVSTRKSTTCLSCKLRVIAKSWRNVPTWANRWTSTQSLSRKSSKRYTKNLSASR